MNGWLVTFPTLAQAGGQPDTPWVAVLFAVVLIIGVGVASLMGSRRSHQD